VFTEGRYRPRWNRLSSVLVVLVLAFFAGPGCGHSDSDGTGPGGPFQLTFRLDASFQALHGGQPVEIAVVRASDGSVVVQANGAVSATQDPSFTWSTGPVMQAGIEYEVHYWIDSNFGGGTSKSAIPKPSITSGAWNSCRCPMT
jgi:hypothetical protein